MHPFNYQRPKSLAEAVAALRSGGDAKLLAGGQSLVAAMKLRLSAPTDLIDLGGIEELTGIRVEGNSISVGAMTRHAEVARSKEVLARIPALASLAGAIGDRMVRNMGTLGGSLAHNDPVADYPAAVLGLDATVNTNQRKIAADDFFIGMFETALQAGEIIVSVSFPVPRRAAYIKFRNQASRYAIVGVMAAETEGGVRVAVTGAASSVFRVAAMEQALAANWSPRRACRHQRASGRSQLGHARQRRIPRAPGYGDGAPRSGGGEVAGAQALGGAGRATGLSLRAVGRGRSSHSTR